MICEVIRQFPGPDGMMAVGTQVDTSNWRPLNVESLIRNRFLRFVRSESTEPEEESAPAPVRKPKKQKLVFKKS